MKTLSKSVSGDDKNYINQKYFVFGSRIYSILMQFYALWTI